MKRIKRGFMITLLVFAGLGFHATALNECGELYVEWNDCEAQVYPPCTISDQEAIWMDMVISGCISFTGMGIPIFWPPE